MWSLKKKLFVIIPSVIILILLIALIVYFAKKSETAKLDPSRMAVFGYSVSAQMVSRLFESFPDQKIQGAVMLGGGNLSCYTLDSSTCPTGVTEPSYDSGIKDFQDHPPTLLVQTKNDWFADPNASIDYYNTLKSNGAPAALVTTDGKRHGLCPCGVDPVINFLEAVLTRENFHQPNKSWSSYCAYKSNEVENCSKTSKESCDGAGCCWDPKSTKGFKCFRPKLPDPDNLSWNGGKNPDNQFFLKLFKEIETNTILSGKKNSRKSSSICNEKLENYKVNKNFNAGTNCGSPENCTFLSTDNFPLTVSQMRKPSVPGSFNTSESICKNEVNFPNSNTCPQYVQYWYKVLTNATWDFSSAKNVSNDRYVSIALPTCGKMPKNGWPFVLYLSFMFNDNGKQVDGWYLSTGSGGLVSLNKNNFSQDNEYGRLELSVVFNSLLAKGIAVVFTSEVLNDSYFYAGGK